MLGTLILPMVQMLEKHTVFFIRKPTALLSHFLRQYLMVVGERKLKVLSMIQEPMHFGSNAGQGVLENLCHFFSIVRRRNDTGLKHFDPHKALAVPQDGQDGNHPEKQPQLKNG